VTGETTYMLNQDEEFLLAEGKDPLTDRSDRSKSAESQKPRDETRVVTFRAVQIYDDKENKAR